MRLFRTRTLLLLALLLPALPLTSACAGRAGSPSSAATTSPRAVDPAVIAPSIAASLQPGDPIPRTSELIHGKLDNGMSYFIRENRRPENRVEIRLVVNAGSVLEDEDQRGLAHFVEHMAFNGSRNFQKQDLVAYLESIGMRFGPDLNAYTSFDETVYVLKLPTDDPTVIDKAFLIMDDWATGLSFDPEEIDKERGVILEERRLGRGASARMRDEQLPVLFRGSHYADRLPIGSEEVIRDAPYEALQRFYRDWYRPDLMAVIVAGDIDARRMEKLIKKQFSDIPAPESPRERAPAEIPDHEETLVAIATDPEATNTVVSVYQKLDRRPEASMRDYRRMQLESIYESMLNDRLDELRQQPDPPYLFAFISAGEFVRTKDVYVHGAAVEEGQLERGLDALLTELERVDRHGFTRTELERAKKDVIRAYEQGFRERDKIDSSALASELIRHFLTDEPVPGIELELEMVKRLVPEFTLEEVNALASQSIREENRVILVNAPQGTAPDEAELLAVFDAALRKDIAPYEDRVRAEPLVAQLPEPGEIVQRKSLKPIGVTRWRLSNGVQVVLKPTEFQNDQVQLTGFSPGGHSNVPDDQYISALYAASLLSAGGVGNFDLIELQKALAGKVAGVGVYISELEEGVRGAGSPEDLETLFQLVYLHFTSPRLDGEATASWRHRFRGFLENRDADPETVFFDKLSATLSQDHPRKRPPAVEDLDALDDGAALDIYRDRFADASDFTFILVGNFDPQSIEPLVRTYLGGLPSSGRKETFRDIGASPPDGVVNFEVRKGLEQKSRVSVIYNGEAEWTRENRYVIQALSSALSMRLREVLREDMGGTYGVSVDGGMSRWPKSRYSIRVTFGCAPENVESLTQAVFDEVEVLKLEGVSQVNIEKLKEKQLRERETDLKENGFWLQALTNAYRHGLDPLDILHRDRDIRGLKRAHVIDAARRFLDQDRRVVGVLYPETHPGADGR